MTSEQMGWPGLSEHGRRLGRRPSATRTIICAILCLANQVNQLANVQADQQQQQHQAARAAFATSRYELKFQNELDNSTVIKHLAQQQVFKCQVRLAPHGQTTIAAQSAGASSNHQVRRLKSSSSWLSSEAAERKYLKALQELHNDQLSRMLLTSADTAGSEQQQQQQHRHKYKQLVNITHLSIDWLKDGQSVWGAFPSEPVSIVNVTLRAQRTLDKVARPMKSRVEIKNTLNGQQMKLTSRLRLSHLRPTDSGQYKCVARVSFLQRPIEQQHQLAASSGDSGTGGELIEYIEQSLESVGAHLIVMALNSNHTNDNGEATTINFQQQNGGSLQANGKGPTGASSQALPPTTATGHDNEVRRRKAESSRPQIYPDDTQDTDDSLPGPNERSQSANGAGSQVTTGPQSNPLFEDDEDLFRLDLTELINGQQQQQLATNDNINSQDQQVVGGVGTGGANSSETMDSHANDLLVNSQQIARERQHEAYLDWILDNGDDPASLRSSASDDASLGGSLSALFSGEFHQQSAAANRFGDKKIDDPGSSLANADVSNSSAPAHRDHGQHSRADELVGRSSAAAAGASPPLDHRRGDDHALSPIPSSSSAPLFVSQLRPISPPPSPADPRSKLARFVHKIVPEPSCYTGLGEHYRGNASISSDQRPCLNWLQVRVALSRTAQSRPTTTAMANSGQNRTPQAAAAWGTPLAPIQQPGLARGRTDDHNHCRNPNNDQRGPWCFVSYSEELDGALVKRPYLSANSQQWKTATSKQRTVRVDPESGQLFVVAPCQLASCSEYLWLYVVAPPLGLLVLLTCLLSLFIRSIRKSHYNAIFSAAYQRHNDPSAKSTGLLCKFMQSRKRLVIDGSELVASSKRNGWACCGIGSLLKKSLPFASPASPRKKRQAGSSRGTYLDEDMFEVVDDIDWSDGQPTSTTSQSMSPSESFRLHSTATTCDEHHHSIKSPTGECRQNCNWSHMSNLTHSKSINPMCGGNQVAALDLPMGNQTRQQQSAVMSSNTPKMSKSRSQVGPMFATLRCHVRNTHNQQQQQRQPNGTRGIQNCPQLARKSSSFIENGQLDPCQQQLASAEKQETTCDRASNLSSLRTTATTIDDHSIAASGKTTGLLLSCGSSSGASSGSGGSNSALVAGSSSSSTAATLANRNNNINKIGASENYTLASELTRLDASSVTLAYDMQAIYEGKFSQVQMAYLKQRKDDLAQATGRIGAQVAVCSLKEQAALDESVFYATNLRVRNLNHLNILKLLGYVQLDNDNYNLEDSSMNNSSIVRANAKCSLVYDMAHMIDLNDWLKEQCKDTFDARNNNSDLCLRQNLTCLAKQIALALDYLHDKNIVYKDLACRNCFLDVTRMLVKLASFNIEPEFEVGDDVGGRNSESGGRDRYYNVGDSDADLISKKLSLKSMVRPKYLLDYYVIDSRPAECQLLPLSWISLESILFNKFNKNTDIWSFGCLLYELFSLGEVAYFGYSSKQVIDSVRSNLMPPQPLLCPNGIYKLMCKCLSDIPTLRPNIKHVYEQLNLYSGQCSSFLNHHLCII